MTAKNTFVLSLTIDRASENEFGCTITNVSGMPADMEFSPRSNMAKYGTIVVKTKKVAQVEPAPKAAAKAAPAPVAIANEANVQALLATPGIAGMLQHLMAAQGGAAVLPPVEAPSISKARGRPSSKK
jgi:hypothetical protein